LVILLYVITVVIYGFKTIFDALIQYEFNRNMDQYEAVYFDWTCKPFFQG